MTAATAHVPDSDLLRKARGAFFTPEPLARFVTDWAVRDVADRVLEPSCGEAAFLLAAVERLGVLGVGSVGSARLQVDGVELHAASAESAERLLRDAGADASIRVGDFFDVTPTGAYDAVVGNPPYVRYQEFAGEARSRSRAAALRAGVPLTALASSWAAFTVHASLFLRAGGRMGLVLPAELLSVNYAAPVRRFLMEKFARVDLVLFEERVFPGVLEEVVLLQAEGFGEGPTEHCSVRQVRDSAALADLEGRPRLWRPRTPESKWTGSMLSTDALAAYSSVIANAGCTVLEAWGDTTLGMVTGNNRYFALSPARMAELGLTSGDVLPLSPPGSRHLRGLQFDKSSWLSMGSDGAATFLFRPKGQPSRAAAAYIAAGEAAGVDRAYKCRVRAPWWRVPRVKPADMFLTYMNADTPRLSANLAKVHHLNSVHGLYLKSQLRRLGIETLPLAAINSMTLLGAEIVGRAYGGGMLKLEPREADLLPVPTPAAVEDARADLVAVRSDVARQLQCGQLVEAAAIVDDVLLVRRLGLTRSDLRALREGRAELAARRAARGKKDSSNG